MRGVGARGPAELQLVRNHFSLAPFHCIHQRSMNLFRAKLEALAKQTVNECFATDITTQEIIARVNEGRAMARILDDDWSDTN